MDPTVQLKFRVPEDLRTRLDGAARKRHISLNAEITRRLEQSFSPDASAKIGDVLAGVHILDRQVRALEGKMEGSELQKEVSNLLDTLSPLQDHVVKMVQAILRQEFSQ